MRLNHRLIGPVSLSATAAMLTMALALAWGAEAGLAADYQNGRNVCEGQPSCTDWAVHVTGKEDTALGDEMMTKLTSGSGNLALDFGALEHDETGSGNVALGARAGSEIAKSNNIDINNTGESGDEGTTRIGTEGVQTHVFVAGIAATDLFEGCTVQVSEGPDGGFLGCNPQADGYLFEWNAALGGAKMANLPFGLGNDNVAVDLGSLDADTNGSDNIAIGKNVLTSNTDGNANVAIGTEALKSNTDGSNNIASGKEALKSNTTGKSNTATGAQALESNTTGTGNVAVGSDALRLNTTASFNLAYGDGALRSNTTGENNVANGVGALESNTTGTGNMASGGDALDSNTTGTNNIAIGLEALFTPTAAENNVAVGNTALKSDTSGKNNLALGKEALHGNTGGNSNLASGSAALAENTTGSGNAAYGVLALDSNTTGENNIASGTEALQFNKTGSGNIAFGNRAGFNIENTSGNIDIANAGVAGDEKATRIGTQGTQAKAFMAGVWNDVATGSDKNVKVNAAGQLFTTKGSSAAFKQEVHPIATSLAQRVLSLRPVTYHYKPQYAQGADQLEYGLIAQQVAPLFPSLVEYEAKGKPDSVDYEELPVLLLADVQREHAEVSDQQREIERDHAQLQGDRAQASHQQHEIDQLAGELQSLDQQMRHR